MSRMSNVYNLVKVLSLTALGIFLACAAGELLVRVGTADQKNYVIEMWRYANSLKQPSADPDIGHEHRPGRSATLQGVDISINSLGMRGPEPMPDSAIDKRIVILGDSVALGWGVPEQDTLRSQLAHALPAKTEVLNAGVGNMNLAQIVALGTRLSHRIHIDTVVLLCTPRAPEVQPRDGAGWLLKHSELAALLVTFVRQATSGAAGRERLIEAYRANWTHGPGLEAMTSAMDRLAALQNELGFKVVVALVPESHDFNDYRFGFITDVMARESAARGWPFVDLLPLLQGPANGTYWVSTNDIHLNGKAYSLIANRLLPLLRQ